MPPCGLLITLLETSQQLPVSQDMKMRDPEITSRIMRRIPQRDTRAELMLRKELFGRGLRYRKNVNSLPGRPDIVFRTARLAVFVDGNFWHGREWQTRGHKKLEDSFKTNIAFWVNKIEGNMRRDKENTRKLQSHGWSVMRFWASDVESDLHGVADQIEASLCEIRKLRS
jgi:DNA mismatch endonuclease (patch repair protein)